MLTCGLKLTHDGSVALIDGNQLVFSVEMEKLNNNPRYSAVEELDSLPDIFEKFGYDLNEVDHFVVDGWGGSRCSSIEVMSGGQAETVKVAPYHENLTSNILYPSCRGNILVGGRKRPYTSYFHVAGHVTSAYFTSPFASRGENAFVLVWDGGMFPRLYYVDRDRDVIENGGALFPVMGHLYATAGNYFGPWPRAKKTNDVAGHEIAGKLMAYVSLGQERPEITEVLARLWVDAFTGQSSRAVANRKKVGGWGIRDDVAYLGEYFRDLRAELGTKFSDEDVLASMHAFVRDALVQALTDRVSDWKSDQPSNLCFSGGCALNIKWNSEIREQGLFRETWVPPFPNDSGLAIGAALCHAVSSGPATGFRALQWHVRLGPDLVESPDVIDGWAREECDIARLADVLHTEQRPVVVLNGRAELGPRALGGRSIIAPATDPSMKDRLNEIKRREPYRPVAPICLESDAEFIFDPGTPDPYMLYDHRVRPKYVDQIPAVVHLDGTARLQTVNNDDDPLIAELLLEYRRLSGIGVLCNTSANYNGSGFFPDLRSAAEWGRVDAIWNGGYLYRKARRG